jgi:hypothetical protein
MWLVFVDTNILLDFYGKGGESAERQLAALERHKDSLIIGEQVKMEYLKNRQKVIVEGQKNVKSPDKPFVPPYFQNISLPKLGRRPMRGP